MKKVAVFLDGANCFYTQKKMGWNIDAEKLLDYCKEYHHFILDENKPACIRYCHNWRF